MKHLTSQRGVTLIELIVSIVVISIAITSVLGLLSYQASHSGSAMIQAQATHIANAYLNEVLQKPFQSQANPGGRAYFNDVRDYNGIADVGATDQFGNAITGLSAFTVRISVINAALGTVVPASQSMRVDVTVQHNSGTSVIATGYKNAIAMNASTANYSIKQQGFTLIELVVAIVISTIVVGFIAMFMTTPIDNYFAQSRRAELIIEADLIQRNIDQDVRNAVPNSIRTVKIGPKFWLEMLHAVDVTRYRDVNTTIPSTPGDELDFSTPDGSFSVYGIFNPITLGCAPGTFLIVNQSQTLPGQNAYMGNNAITPSSSAICISNVTGKGVVTITPTFRFASPSPTHNVFVSSGPVAYECDEAAHTLTRFSRYPIAPGIAANINPAAGTLISNDINANGCNFNYSSSTSSRADLLTASIQLQRAGETFTTFIQSAVENLP